jgi:hypothetical protein
MWVTAKLSTAEELNKNVDELGFVLWKVDFDKLTDRADYEDRIKKYREVMKHSRMKTQFTLCPEYDDPRYGWYYCKEYGTIYKNHREEIFNCYTFPIGEKPDNQSWSGFQMINEDNGNGNYILLFRELHNTESRKSVQLKFLAGKTIKISDIESGKSRLEKVPESGFIEFSVKDPGNYLFLTYSVIK